MIDFNCFLCGKPIEFPSYIDPDDYDGQVKCHTCNLLFDVRLKRGKLKKRKLAIQPATAKIEMEYA